MLFSTFITYLTKLDPYREREKKKRFLTRISPSTLQQEPMYFVIPFLTYFLVVNM